MKRAYQIEMTVMHQYARQLLGLGVFVAACTCVGMGSIAAAPGVLTCMYFIMGALATSAFDEQNGWGLFRLTMPLSRRDVVIGRYGMIATIGLIGMVAGLVGGTALAAIATVAPLPGDLSTTFGLTQDNIQAMIFSCSLCAVIGSGIAAIETPVYLRFGQTKATQWIPMVSVILFDRRPWILRRHRRCAQRRLRLHRDAPRRDREPYRVPGRRMSDPRRLRGHLDQALRAPRAVAP